MIGAEMIDSSTTFPGQELLAMSSGFWCNSAALVDRSYDLFREEVRSGKDIETVEFMGYVLKEWRLALPEVADWLSSAVQSDLLDRATPDTSGPERTRRL